MDASFAQTRDNGRVTVDPSKVVGGVYDPALSSVEQNAYGNAYQFALVAAADKFGQAEPDTAELSPGGRGGPPGRPITPPSTAMPTP